MCTLLVRFRPGDTYPVGILSNRDEFYARPSGSWAWRGRNRRYFSPVDLQAGGTWIGLNESGVVVALTNIFPSRKEPAFPSIPLGTVRSRGALVKDMLALNRADQAPAEMRRQLAEHNYDNFNLLVADGAAVLLFTWDRAGLRVVDLAPGVYLVDNVPYDGSRLPDPGGVNESWLVQEAERLKEHPDICRHGESYGTRASHKLLLNGEEPSSSLVWHLDGHPCQGSYELVLGPRPGHAE